MSSKLSTHGSLIETKRLHLKAFAVSMLHCISQTLTNLQSRHRWKNLQYHYRCSVF